MKDYSFGNYICALRRGRGLSQFQLGTLVGVSDKAVSKWENGDAKPKLATCFRLADALGVPIDELLSCKQHTITMARKELNSMNRELWKRAYDRLSIYGENPPVICWSRLAAEEAALQGTDAIQGFAVLSKIAAEAQKNNEVVFVVGTIASSFAAWLMGATIVNPLPPHYRCPKCGKTEFEYTVADGFDLAPRKCDCGEEFLRDGHNIPFDGYAKTERNGTHIEIRVSEQFQPVAEEVIKSFYADKAELVPVRLLHHGHPISVKKYVVLREHRAKPALSADGVWCVEASECWAWLEDEITFTLALGYDNNRIQMLQEKTNTKIPDPLTLATPEMVERLYQKRCETAAFITEKLSGNEPLDFDLLVHLDGFRHASGAWIANGDDDKQYSNGEKIVSAGKARFRDVPALREDIWHDISAALARNGIHDNGLALKTMEDTRMGKYYSKGMPAHIEKLLLSLGLPVWYPDFLKKVMYLYPKGHCISLLLMDMIYEWYCVNYPEEVEQCPDTF